MTFEDVKHAVYIAKEELIEDSMSEGGSSITADICHAITNFANCIIAELAATRHGAMKIMLDEGAYMPERGHEWDAGLDLKTPKRLIIRAHDEEQVDFGVHVQIPKGWCGILKSKSGLNFKVRLNLPGDGVVDCGFTGSIKTVIENRSSIHYTFQPGEKVCQLVIVPCLTPELRVVDHLEETERGASGWGSTGK